MEHSEKRLSNMNSEEMVDAYINTPQKPEKIVWYKKAFEKFDQGKKWQWSWWGFFMGPWFLIYRKVYAWGIFLLVLAAILPSLVEQTAGSALSEAQARIITSFILMPFYVALGGLSAYLIYRRYRHKKKIVEEVYAEQEQRIEALQKIGGSNKAIFIVPAFIVVLGIASSVIIPQLIELDNKMSVPKCSDPQTVELVKQIISDNAGYAMLLGINRAEDLKLDAIRTVKKDKDIGMYTCKANLDLGDDKKDSILAAALSNITYTVSMTDDGKQFYVEIVNNQ